MHIQHHLNQASQTQTFSHYQFEYEKIVSWPQMKKYSIFFSVLNIFLLVSIGFYRSFFHIILIKKWKCGNVMVTFKYSKYAKIIVGDNLKLILPYYARVSQIRHVWSKLRTKCIGNSSSKIFLTFWRTDWLFWLLKVFHTKKTK